MRKSLWSPEEDAKLQRYVTQHGYGNWSDVAKHAGLQRCGKSCRLRWINYLRPDLKRGKFSPEEIRLIVNLHRSLGNSWSKIAACLPGRTDNDIKNFWHSYTRSTRVVDSAKGKVGRSTPSSSLAMRQPCNDLGIQAQSGSLQIQFSKCSASPSDLTSVSNDSQSNNYLQPDCEYAMAAYNDLVQCRVYEEPIQSEPPKLINITCSPTGYHYIEPASEIHGELHINKDMNSLSSNNQLSTDDFYAVEWDAAPPEGLQSVIWNFMNGRAAAQKNPDHLGAWRVQQHTDIFGSMARADLIEDLFKDQ